MPETVPEAPDLEPEDEDDEPLRWWVLALFVVAVVAGFAVTVLFFLSWSATCDDKALGSAVAGDSTRAALCESGSGAAVLLIPGGWAVGLGAATYALVRWGGGPLRAAVCGVLLLAPAGLPAAAYGGLHLSGTNCSDDELAAYRAWVDDGSKGRAPYACRTF